MTNHLRDKGGERELRNHITTSDASKRGPALESQMASRDQEICMAVGNTKLISPGGTKDVLTELKNFYDPDATDAA